MSLQKGLVAHWTMSQDSLKGSLLADKTPYENDGTIYGATFTTDRKGKANSAMSFDGVDDYIDCEDQAGKILSDPSISGKLTIVLWISINGGSYILSSGGQTSSRGFTISNQEGSPHIGLSNGFKKWFVSPVWNQNTWISIAFSWDGVSLKYYKDGEFGLTHPGIDYTVSDTQTFLSIGKPNNTSNYFFNGKIQNIRIYNKALTENEIKLLYNNKN